MSSRTNLAHPTSHIYTKTDTKTPLSCPYVHTLYIHHHDTFFFDFEKVLLILTLLEPQFRFGDKPRLHLSTYRSKVRKTAILEADGGDINNR